MGRTKRKRKRRGRQPPYHHPRTLTHEPGYVHLVKWMRGQGYQDVGHLLPTMFTDGTGRGLRTSSAIQPGQLVTAIPEAVMITYDTIARSNVGRTLEELHPLEALCAFLLIQKSIGAKSKYKAYFATLPESYDTPGYFSPTELECLPTDVRTLAERQRQSIRTQYDNVSKHSGDIAVLYPNFKSHFEYDDYLWAWATVNTRSVHMTDRLGCALAPFLDFLNHRTDVDVDAGFNAETKRYEIRTRTPYKKHDQVFICYGQHDNTKLLVEYGFITKENANDIVSIGVEELIHFGDSYDRKLCFQDGRKLQFIRENCCDKIHFAWDGPSWNLLCGLRLLTTQEFDSRNRNYYRTVEPNRDEIANLAPLYRLILTRKGAEIKRCSRQIANLTNEYRRTMFRTLLEERLRILDSCSEYANDS